MKKVNPLNIVLIAFTVVVILCVVLWPRKNVKAENKPTEENVVTMLEIKRDSLNMLVCKFQASKTLYPKKPYDSIGHYWIYIQGLGQQEDFLNKDFERLIEYGNSSGEFAVISDQSKILAKFKVNGGYVSIPADIVYMLLYNAYSNPNILCK